MNMIVSVDINRGIGKDGNLLVKIPQDMKFFKETTIGDGNNIVVMGSKTYESIGKPLPNRRNIILTGQPMRYQNIDGIEAYCKGDLDYILKDEPNENIFIIGGESLYKQYIDQCYTLYITTVYNDFGADRHFPEFDKSKYIKSTLRCGGTGVGAKGVRFDFYEWDICRYDKIK